MWPARHGLRHLYEIDVFMVSDFFLLVDSELHVLSVLSLDFSGQLEDCRGRNGKKMLWTEKETNGEESLEK